MALSVKGKTAFVQTVFDGFSTRLHLKGGTFAVAVQEKFDIAVVKICG